MESGINYWAVLVSGVAFWILGAIWYAGPVFGKMWMSGVGKTEEQLRAGSMAVKLITVLILGIIAAYGIARVMVWSGHFSAGFGALVGLLAGICFIGTTLGMNDVMEGRAARLFWINWLYQLVGYVGMGVLIGLWH